MKLNANIFLYLCNNIFMKKTNCKKITYVICGAIVGFVNGFFGGGGGMVCVPVLKKFCGYNEKQSHATTIGVILPLCIASSFVYIYQNDIDFLSLALLSLGAIVGGILGAKLLCKLNSKWIEIIFALIMLFAGIKTLL